MSIGLAFVPRREITVLRRITTPVVALLVAIAAVGVKTSLPEVFKIGGRAIGVLVADTGRKRQGAARAAVVRALGIPTPDRIRVIAQAFRHGLTVEEVNAACAYEPWFLRHIPSRSGGSIPNSFSISYWNLARTGPRFR